MHDRIEDRNQPTQLPEPGDIIRRWLTAVRAVESLPTATAVRAVETVRPSSAGVAA